MSHPLEALPTYRELETEFYGTFYDHLLRLGPTSRYMRFGHAVSDDFLRDYAGSMGRHNIVCFGAFIDGALRAAAELRRISDLCPLDGEIGLTVEDDWQDTGIGTDLLFHVQAAARQRGVETIYMICSRKNYRMRSVAQKVHARVKPLPNQIFGWQGEAGPVKQEAAADQLAHYSDFLTYSLDL